MPVTLHTDRDFPHSDGGIGETLAAETSGIDRPSDLVAQQSGTAKAKIRALQDAGATISRSPARIGVTMERVLRERRLLK